MKSRHCCRPCTGPALVRQPITAKLRVTVTSPLPDSSTRTPCRGSRYIILRSRYVKQCCKESRQIWLKRGGALDARKGGLMLGKILTCYCSPIFAQSKLSSIPCQPEVSARIEVRPHMFPLSFGLEGYCKMSKLNRAETCSISQKRKLFTSTLQRPGIPKFYWDCFASE